MRASILAAVAAVLVLAPAAHAQGPFAPLNDLAALGQGFGQTPDKLPIQHNAEPPFAATPRAQCGPGAKPEPGIQGRVPAGSADQGLQCNLTLVSHQGNSGGFKVLRYIDPAGHECAFYDSALLFPVNALKLDATSTGVVVLDMSDPAHPKMTDQLTEPPMLSPHESLVVNSKRGLIAAVSGNPSTYPGFVSIYDASKDCRHPVLQSTTLSARLGHESGFSQDGKTFYAAGTAYESVTAIDVTDPKAPHPVSQLNELSHGLSLSDDGNRAYIADALGGDMLILDTSEIQARKPNPQAREVSRLSWKAASIPQNAIPFTRDGHPYILEIDEYTAGTTNGGNPDDVGAARIIDIGDERKPVVIANLRLQVDQPADHAKATADKDPGTTSPAQGYAAHYCGISSRVDPMIVACSFIASGLRVFDISKLTAPKEIGYYVAPTSAKPENGFDGSNYAMSQPVIVPERKEIWYSDGPRGFSVLRVADAAWPKTQATTAPTTKPKPHKYRCASQRAFAIHVRLPRGARVKSVRARLGKRRFGGRQRGRYAVVKVNLRGLRKGEVKVRVRVRLSSGRVVRDVRTYHPCTKKRG